MLGSASWAIADTVNRYSSSDCTGALLTTATLGVCWDAGYLSGVSPDGGTLGLGVKKTGSTFLHCATSGGGAADCQTHLDTHNTPYSLSCYTADAGNCVSWGTSGSFRIETTPPSPPLAPINRYTSSDCSGTPSSTATAGVCWEVGYVEGISPVGGTIGAGVKKTGSTFLQCATSGGGAAGCQFGRLNVCSGTTTSTDCDAGCVDVEIGYCVTVGTGGSYRIEWSSGSVEPSPSPFPDDELLDLPGCDGVPYAELNCAACPYAFANTQPGQMTSSGLLCTACLPDGTRLNAHVVASLPDLFSCYGGESVAPSPQSSPAPASVPPSPPARPCGADGTTGPIPTP